MKERLKKIAKGLLYPLFYLFCLALFGYLTFPYNRLKDRLIAEFDRLQSKKSQSAQQRLEIDDLTSYWFTGVKAKGVRVYIPPDEPKGGFDSASMAKAALATMGSPEDAPKESVLAVDVVEARLRILPLLLGRVRVAFWASAFGGTVDGVVPVGGSSGPVEVELADLDIGAIDPLVQLVGLPLKGTAAGKLELTASEGKFNKANGTLDVAITGASIGDGKTKWKGQLALPEARLGEISITAEAKEGTLKITKLASTGPDVELIGEGSVKVKEPWNDSVMDLYVRFKFSDAYRDKNDNTRSLLGAPGAALPGLIEIVEPKVKRAKRTDGFYGFHVTGPLKRPKFEPSTADAPSGGASSSKPSRGKSGDSPFAAPKKPITPALPLGTSEARPDSAGAAPPPSPPEAPPARVGASPSPAEAATATRPQREEAPSPAPDEAAPPTPPALRGTEPPSDR